MQLLILKIQETKPRFFCPAFVIRCINRHIYIYDTRFDDEALISNGTYKSDDPELVYLETPQEKTEKKIQLRKEKLQN